MVQSLTEWFCHEDEEIGGRGQPCLRPREDWNASPGLLLIRGEIQGLDIQETIRLTKGDSKPILFRTTIRKECLTLSKAFTRSSFKTNPFSFLDRLEWMASWTRRMESVICMLGRKPPWFSNIKEGRRGLSLVAKILVRIFYEELQREMGRNLEKEEGRFSLGMRARKVELVNPPSFPYLCTHQIIFVRSFFIRFQNSL